MAFRNQTMIQCKLQIIQKGTRTTQCEQETYGHINSVFYDEMTTTVTAAHHFIWRHLYFSMQTAQTPASKLRVVSSDQERSMNTLWQEEEFEKICSRESLTEKAADIEKMICERVRKRTLYF